jgi:putative nucleotidyltransferase with HDIG domain
MEQSLSPKLVVRAVGAYPMVLFTATLAVTASALAGALWVGGYPPGPFVPVLALGGLAFLGERRSIRISGGIELSVSFLPLVFAAVLFGPLAAMLVGSIGLLSQFGRPHVRWLVWTSSRALAGGAAGLAAWLMADPGSGQFGVLLAAAALASTAEVLADLALNSATARVRGTVALRDVLRTHAPLIVVAVPLYTPIVAVLAFAYTQASPWSVFLFLIPAFAAQRLFLLYREQRETSEELVTVNARLEKANLSFAAALVATLDARDQYTAGHSASVAIYARDIAERMGLSEEEQQLAHLAGLVHDIGKVGLPGGLLEKTGPLTLDERRQMEQHSAIGERILSNVEDYAEIATIVRHHHERVDGLGYPDGLAQDDIPLIARIIAVADAYDAMTSDRPYRDAMPSRVARLRLAQAVESQFDTSVVAAFEAILAGASEEYRLGRRGDFTFEAQEDAAAVEVVAVAG